MTTPSCRPRIVLIGAALILPVVMVTGLAWWMVFNPFSERVAEAGFIAALLLAPPLAAFVTARTFGGTWCTGGLSGVLFVAVIAVAGAVQAGDPDLYDVLGYGVTAGVFGAAGGFLGTLHPLEQWRSGHRDESEHTQAS